MKLHPKESVRADTDGQAVCGMEVSENSKVPVILCNDCLIF